MSMKRDGPKPLAVVDLRSMSVMFMALVLVYAHQEEKAPGAGSQTPFALA